MISALGDYNTIMLELLFVFLVPPLLFLGACAIIGFSVYAFIKYAHKFDADINTYVAEHHYTYARGPIDIGLKGILESNLAVQHIEGTLPRSGNSFELFSAVSLDKPEQTGQSMTTIRVRIPSVKSRFLFNSRKNDEGISNILPEIYKTSQRIQLEGNFNQYYDVISPENDKTELLTLLGPDVMAYMIDHLTKFDIEIIDDEILFYQSFVLPIAKYDENLALVDTFIEELRLRSADNRSTKPLEQPVSRIGVGKEISAELVRKHDIARTITNIIGIVLMIAFVIFFVAAPFIGYDVTTAVLPYFFAGIPLAVLASGLIYAVSRRRR